MSPTKQCAVRKFPSSSTLANHQKCSSSYGIDTYGRDKEGKRITRNEIYVHLVYILRMDQCLLFRYECRRWKLVSQTCRNT